MDTLIDEILKGCKYDGSYIPVTEVRRLMQLYHEAKLKEITDSDIEAWAKNYYQKADENEISCLIIGAKAHRGNKIKHNG